MLECPDIAHFYERTTTMSHKDSEEKGSNLTAHQIYMAFNNFHLHFLPRGYKDVVKKQGLWNKYPPPVGHYKMSDLAASQTYREFYEMFDKTVEEVSGMQFSDFLKKLTPVLIIRSSSGPAKEIREKNAKDFFALLNPIREKLYEKGYNWNDLCR